MARKKKRVRPARPAPRTSNTMGDLGKFIRDYTAGLNRRDLRRLFDRDFHAAYKTLAREHGDEPEDESERFNHRLKVLFLGISYKLTPARRLLFGFSLIAFVAGLLSETISYERAVDGSSSLEFGFQPLFIWLAFLSLLFVLLLELVDQVRVRDELEVARQLQSALLPQGEVHIPGYRVAHSYRTANTVGGDYYDVLPVGDGRLAVVVGDATGHGMASGLVMAIANATLKTALDLDPSCAPVHSMLNRAICRTGDRRTFMTFFYGLLDPASGQLDYFCAGHPFPIHRRADGTLDELGEGGFPLGLRENLEPRIGSTVLAPGELLLLYSDGLPEAVNGRGEAFGFDRIRTIVAQGGDPSPLHSSLLAAFDRHTESEPLTDDFTLLALARGAELPPLPPPLD